MTVRARPMGWDLDKSDPANPTLDGMPEWVTGELQLIPVHSTLFGNVHYTKNVIDGIEVDPTTVQEVARPPQEPGKSVGGLSPHRDRLVAGDGRRAAPKYGDSWQDQPRNNRGEFGSGDRMAAGQEVSWTTPDGERHTGTVQSVTGRGGRHQTASVLTHEEGETHQVTIGNLTRSGSPAPAAAQAPSGDRHFRSGNAATITVHGDGSPNTVGTAQAPMTGNAATMTPSDLARAGFHEVPAPTDREDPSTATESSSGGIGRPDLSKGRTSEGDSIQPYLSTIQGRAASFHNAPGNKVEVLSGRNPGDVDKLNGYLDSVKAQQKAYKEATDESGDSRTTEGLDFMRTAIRHGAISPDASVVVATHDGIPVAAVDYRPDYEAKGGTWLKVGYLGSNQSTRGAATAAVQSMASEAARLGQGVRSSATEDAYAYHQSIGRIMDDNGHSSWSPADCKQIAAAA